MRNKPFAGHNPEEPTYIIIYYSVKHYIKYDSKNRIFAVAKIKKHSVLLIGDSHIERYL
jgi:hypothetical protein